MEGWKTEITNMECSSSSNRLQYTVKRPSLVLTLYLHCHTSDEWTISITQARITTSKLKVSVFNNYIHKIIHRRVLSIPQGGMQWMCIFCCLATPPHRSCQKTHPLTIDRAVEFNSIWVIRQHLLCIVGYVQVMCVPYCSWTDLVMWSISETWD